MIKAESVGALEEADTPLFRGLDVVVNSGDTIGVVGTNGSGKTTLLHLLAGTIEPTVGVVTRRGARRRFEAGGRPSSTSTSFTMPEHSHSNMQCSIELSGLLDGRRVRDGQCSSAVIAAGG
jgi:ABC-type Mn2+/Zn2+ transport system ATPase subunit